MSPRSPFDDFDPRAYRFIARAARIIGKLYFRFELRGLDRLPDGPCLVVGNHSGLGIVEEALLLGAWEERFGSSRRAWGLVHDFFWDAPVSSSYYRRIGAVPAAREHARAAFARGDVVLVFPGGDFECCRPLHQARTVDFGGRHGYVEVALETGVPVVPLATVGSHWTWTFLPGGIALAKIPGVRRLLRMDRVPVPTAVLGLTVAFAAILLLGLSPWWFLPAAALALLPTPAKITSVLLPPMTLRADADDPVTDGDRRVRAALQQAVQTIGTDADPATRERPSPSH